MLELDSYDRRILAALQQNGRMPMAEVAQRVGLSTSPCWRRTRRLEANGVIQGYSAQVAPEAVGLGLNAFVYVLLNLHQAEAFEETILDRAEVVECFAMTGDEDYLLHIMVPDMAAFDHFVRKDLIQMPGVGRVNTAFALKTIKARTSVPLNGVKT